MMWRVRTTLADRPGILAEIALACGRAEAGADAVADAPTRWLAAVQEVIEGERDIEAVLHDLLATTPPDVVDYAGHDVLDLTRRDGSTLRISRAVPFTAIEKSRSQALLSLVGDAGRDMPLIAPIAHAPAPLVRAATLADLEAVAALHQRCGVDTIYRRYQAPLRLPLTTRLARRLVQPDTGTALVVQVGMDVVAHGLLESSDQSVATLRLLVEDAWQTRGLGTLVLRRAAGLAKAAGADHLTLVAHGDDGSLVRTASSAGFVARVERQDDEVRVTVPLRLVEPIRSS